MKQNEYFCNKHSCAFIDGYGQRETVKTFVLFEFFVVGYTGSIYVLAYLLDISASSINVVEEDGFIIVWIQQSFKSLKSWFKSVFNKIDVDGL